MGRRRDAMAVLEAAYDLRAPEPLWLEGLLEAARALLDDGHGMMACIADFEGSPQQPLRTPVALGGSLEWQRRWRRDWWEDALLRMPVEALVAVASFAPVSYGTHAIAAVARRYETLDVLLQDLAAQGYARTLGRFASTMPPSARDGRVLAPEALQVFASEPTGHVVAIVANRAEPAAHPPSRRVLRDWSRIAAHVAAAFRLRRGVAALRARDEAVFSPNGRVLHAEGPAASRDAIAALREAAIAVDRARTAAVRGTDEALELWRALHEGRWSIVDVFDNDGRRFLVARANEPASAPAPALSRREQQVVDRLALGHSNRMIAYELGISASSVATHLRRASAKLRLSSTRELVRWPRARRRPTDGDAASDDGDAASGAGPPRPTEAAPRRR